MASVPGYMYAQKGDTLYVNLFAGGTADMTMASGRSVKIAQETRYPWDGAVRIMVHPQKPDKFTINVRVPGWARGEAVPSGLYSFVEGTSELVTLKVNRRSVPIHLEKGYVSLARNWHPGDVIELHMPMPVRRVVSNQEVQDDLTALRSSAGRLCIAPSGPIIHKEKCSIWRCPTTQR